MAAITKKTTIGEVLARDINTAKYFLDMGMHCLGCPSSQGGASKKPAWYMEPMRTSLSHRLISS